MTPRENALAVINWGKPESVPIEILCYHPCLASTGIVDQPWMGGKDMFGLDWVCTVEGPMPEPGFVLFDDIADWRDHVVFPDLDAVDFNAIAAQELAHADRNMRLINAFSVCGIFERMIAFMGFENALCALIDDPESCKDFFNAMADFKIKLHDKIIEAYKPDIITYFDDMASAQAMFMSMDIYREIIKPAHKRIIDAVLSKGVIFTQHMCGKCEAILDDLVEMGVKVWSSAQPINDLVAVKDKYRGKLVVEGGWDTTGPCSWVGATVEQAIEEAQRCVREYGPNGGFIMQITLMNERGNSLRVGDPRLEAILKEWQNISSY